MTSATPPPGALDDIRVLDLTGEIGLYCTKLLADLGADVILIEPPGGHPARRIGPFYHDAPDPERSLFFFNFNTSKRSITLDIEKEDGKVLLKRLVSTADVIVETFPPHYMEALGLGYEDLQRQKRDLIYCSITGFGLWGPHAHYKASDLITVAMSGMMYLAGYPEDPPNLPYGNQSYHCASIHAAAGVLTALYHRDRTGEGQMIEVSVQEANSMNQETAMMMWDMRRELRHRVGGSRRLPGIGTYPCKDGYVMAMVGTGGGGMAEKWPLMIRWMADEGLAGDLDSPEWLDFFTTINPREINQLFFRNDVAALEPILDKFKHVDEVLENFFRQFNKLHLYEEGQRRDLLIGPVNTPKDLAENPHILERRWFTDVEHPELGQALRYPGGPYRHSETPWRIRRRPPLIGEHNREIYQGELGLGTSDLETLAGSGVI